MERNVQEVMQATKAPGRPDHANGKGGSRVIVVDCCGEIAADLCKLLKKLAGTTRLELATSAVTEDVSEVIT